MTALATSSGGSRATAASSIDHVIRLSTAAAVLAVAGIAAYVSYWHAYTVVRAYGGSGITARLEPTIDGVVSASSMVILYAARHRLPAPSLARWLLGLGIAATLTANMAQGWAHGPVGAMVAAWPAVSLVSSYELLVWLIRTAGTLEREPPAEHCCGSTACRTAARSAPAAAIDSGQHSRNDRDLSAQGWPPKDQLARQPVTLASVEHSDEVPGAGTDNDAAVAAYRLSQQAGNPLSERKLAQMFGRTSRRWAARQDRRCTAITVRIQPRSALATGSYLAPSLFRGLSFLNPFQAWGIIGPAHPHLCRPPSLFGALVWAGGGERLRSAWRTGRRQRARSF